LAFAAIFGYWKLRDRALTENINDLKEEIKTLREWRHDLPGDLTRQIATCYSQLIEPLARKQNDTDTRMREFEGRLRDVERHLR
jgi:hypothetical protein